ncbi:MAG: hypothetical protein ING69_00160 [Rhodocyclaceae bacterium]|nr:hypothetical protein [Rhodocyclaceae bacterium]MCA3166948.1 hypothetical protein [Burkholderiales bacterium]
MAQSHVVSGLVAKRGEIAGQIESYETEIKRLHAALSHLDGTIKLFAPEVNLRTVKTRTKRKRNQYFIQGEAQRMTLDAMRESGVPVCSREITDVLMQRKGIAFDASVAARIQKNILAVMHRLEKKKAVKKIDKDGEPLKWKLV